MTPDRHAQIKQIFIALCEMAPDQREAAIDKACEGDEDMRRELRLLLDNHLSKTLDSNSKRQADPAASAIDSLTGQTPFERSMQPGVMIAGRYRVVAPIGKGGMGFVYRAEDLTLGKTIALKFLPEARATDDAWLHRFHQEVRLAREVTHPNICRVYDIGEADGVPFISMEYVEGDDLAALLQRIGRLPGDKALDIARQLCAGLAAAHARGVLHRDLKPANVILDRRGRVRITDFGLAGVVGRIAASEIRSGTPRYMAPEQLAGQAVSTRSDIYSLGLVLYEVFTGRPAFTADSPAEYLKMHESSAPPPPSSVLPYIDPKAESIIMECIRKDPAARPESVLAVAAALPGGDLLAAAMALGETPSPELLATTAAAKDVRRPVVIVAAFAFVLIALLASFLGARTHPLGKDVLKLPPEVLADRARQLLTESGLSEWSVDEAFQPIQDFATQADFLGSLLIPEGYGPGLPDHRGFSFLLRQGSTPLTPRTAPNLLFDNARATLTDPPRRAPGMVSVVLDGTGRLEWLDATPPSIGALTAKDGTIDWSRLIAAAGLDRGRLVETTPQALPRAYADHRRAWETKDGSKEIRVEAAEYRGIPVLFAVMSRPLGAGHEMGRSADALRLRSLVSALCILAAFPLALRNRRLGRSDRRGALRLGGFVVALRLAVWTLSAQHSADLLMELQLGGYALLGAMAEGAIVWMFYSALESYARRFWPETILAWNRVLGGHFRDPILGGNIVAGCLLGGSWALLAALARLVDVWMGRAPAMPVGLMGDLQFLLGGRHAIAACIDTLRDATYQGLFVLMLIVLIRLVFRRGWLAALIAIGIIVPLYLPSADGWFWASLTAVVLGAASAVWAFARFGLITVVTALLVHRLMTKFPPLHDINAWYADISLLAALVAAGLLVYGLLLVARSPVAASPRY